MVETWLPGAERIQGPYWKQGYPGIPRRTLQEIEGEVNHSAEGTWANLLAEIQHPTRQASWTFSIREDGHIVQHYPFESITWHCGRKGDLDPDTEVTGNIALVGKEFAGKRVVDGGQVLTVDQEDAGVYITDFVRDHTFAGTNPPELAVNLWEHNWINPNTECPSDRVNWTTYIAKVEKETDMILFIGRQGGGGGIFDLAGNHLDGGRWQSIRAAAAAEGITIVVHQLPHTDPFFKDIVTFPNGPV